MLPGDLPPEDVLGGEEGMGQEYDNARVQPRYKNMTGGGGG